MAKTLQERIDNCMDLYFHMNKKEDDSKMTTLQKDAYDNDRRIFLNKYADSLGIKLIDNITYNDYHESYQNGYKLVFSDNFIEGEGTIIDIRSNGQFPIRLKVNNQAEVVYEPRNLDKIPQNKLSAIPNSEFLHLMKGSTLKIKGKIVDCNVYFHKNIPDFKIVGDGTSTVGDWASSVDDVNLQEAKKNGSKNGLIGGLIGIVAGLVIYLALLLILWIYNLIAEKDIHLGFFISVIIFVIPTLYSYYEFYKSGFSDIRKSK